MSRLLFFICLLFSFVPSASASEFYPVSYAVCTLIGQCTTPRFDSIDAACRSYTYNRYYTYSHHEPYEGTYGYVAVCKTTHPADDYFSNGALVRAHRSSSCPANSSPSTSPGACVCDAGYIEQNGQCVANVCEAGQSSSALVPVAWARYYTGGTGSIPIEGGGTAEIVGEAQIPDAVCMGGCEYWNVGSVRSYISFDRPSGTGSYQVLNELNLETSGSECSEETNLSEPVEPAPVCNGVVGEVNDKKYCAPSDSGGGSGGEGGGTDPGEGGGTDPGEGGSTDPGEGGGNPPGGGSGGGTNPGGGDGDGEDDEGPGGGGGPGAGSEWSVPTFYESKYPDGMSGVWQSSGLGTAAGVFDGLAGAFVPPWSDTNGACQSFYLNLDIGIFNFGRFDISPPCFVWSFLWLCMQLGAIFLFRALVFGG